MKDDYETFGTRIGRRGGKRYAERKPLQVPWHVAMGNYDRLSDLQVREFINDMLAEQQRRSDAEAHRADVKERTGNFNPAATQIRRAT